MNTGIVVAAGRSERMGSGADKAFLNLGPNPLLAYSLMAFENCADIDSVVVVVRREKQLATRGVARMFGCSKVRSIVVGGKRRQDSVQDGLKAVHPDTRFVVIHDAARPMVKPAMIAEILGCARRHGAGVAAQRCVDTVKQSGRGTLVDHTLDRTLIWTVQTPQAFRIDLLQKAFEAVEKDERVVTDEAAALEHVGTPVRLVECPAPNIKVTTPDDLGVIAALMRI